MKRGDFAVAGVYLAVLVVVVVGLLAAAGTGAATVTTDSANFTSVGNDTLANQTLAVDNGTRSLYVSLDNETANASEPANVTVFGVDSEGNETQVDAVQIAAADGTTEMYEYTAIDTANDSDYRVLVEGDSNAIESAALDVGQVAEVSSGGGILGGSSGTSVGIIVAALLAMFVLKGDGD